MLSSPRDLTNDYSDSAEIYSTALDHEGTAELLYQSIPRILATIQPTPSKVLDFGCGAGCSTRALQAIGLNTIGIDISNDMLSQAKKLDPSGDYRKVDRGTLPFHDQSFDMTFSSLVFLEMATKDELQIAFNEIYRTLNLNGYFVMATASPEMFDIKNQWVSVENNYPENLNPCSGKICKIKLKDINLELLDYYWSDDDYIQIATTSGFSCKEIIRPVVKDLPKQIAVNWLSELTVAPYVIFIFQKR